MALRKIIKEGDETLRKISREVTAFDRKCLALIDDMKDTMYEANGVGLASPQVGVLKRIFVMDVHDRNGFMEFINPVFLDKQGEQISCEGCLSIPDFEGDVIRPAFVRIKAFDRYGEEFIYEGEGLAAVCASHEYDHLDGILFRDKVINADK
ncbi:MAG: peptide deformylase [Saccharofermentanales bacterium]